MSTNRLLVLAAVALLTTVPVHAVTIETVPVGNPGNPADTRYAEFNEDPNCCGSVPYAFRMGKTEVTNAQYVEFLNAVAASDPYGLYNVDMEESVYGGIVRRGTSGSFTYAVKAPAVSQGSDGSDYTYENKPVVFVSLFDAMRFVNWLHNRQGNGDTETGAYTLMGATPVPSNWLTVTRNPGARWWLPNEDEWYKAAYYDPIAELYYDYPTGTDVMPNNNLPAADTGNSANFRHGNFTTGKEDFPMTDVGAYLNSASPYGTYDQAGNVWEWLDAPSWFGVHASRGGSWAFGSQMLHASTYAAADSDDEDINIGFRVATIVPEPSTLLLAAFGLLVLIVRRRRSAMP